MASKKNYYWWAVVGKKAVRHYTNGTCATFLIKHVDKDSLNKGYHQKAMDGRYRRAVAYTNLYVRLYNPTHPKRTR